MCVCTCATADVLSEDSLRTQFSPPTVWDLGIKLMLSGLVADACS